MTTEAISALDAERARALELFRSLSAQEWAAPSDCAGWRVQDVAAHMGAVFHTIADPGSIDGGSSPDVEANAEVPVGARKDWTSAEVMADYEEWGAKGREALVALQGQGVATTVVPLANLGSHPLHLLANALVFDHYCHLRWDIAAPNGPVGRDLPQDPAVLTETMTWMLAGLPQMCTDALSVVDRPVTLVLDGPGGGGWSLQPPTEPGGLTSVVPDADGSAAAVVRSTAHEFVCWGTKRRDWRSMGVSIEGDEAYAAQVLDAFNVI
jgi:uncharacterized protein (TIGR03083 family)